MLDSMQWVSRTEDLIEQVEAIGCGPLAVDTEADSFHHYRDKMCLLQMSFAGRDVLVDPLAGLDLSPLRDVLASADVTKLLHGADYDLRILDRDCGLVVRGLFDTMVAARLVGERSFGLAALLSKYLDVNLEKKFQRADWSLRPLPDEMARYAMLDTRHLEELASLLRGRLQELGRLDWAEEEFRRGEQVRWKPARAVEDPWQRLKGLRDLDRRQMAIARELATLRDQTAERRDVPPFRVMRDELIVSIAVSAPQKASELRAIRGLPRPWRNDRECRLLLEAVRRGADLPEAELPVLARRKGRRREPEFERRVKELGRRRDTLAEKLDLEPSVVAPRALLELALDRTDRGEDPLDSPEFGRWQASLLAPLLATI